MLEPCVWRLRVDYLHSKCPKTRRTRISQLRPKAHELLARRMNKDGQKRLLQVDGGKPVGRGDVVEVMT
jgi:hypothetical protein